MKKYVLLIISLLSLGTNITLCRLIHPNIIKSSRHGRLDLIQTTLTHLPSLMYEVDKDGSTALHIAARGGYLDIVKFLLAMGMYIDIPNKGGSSPLYIAAFYGQVSVVKYLVKNGADLNSVNETNHSLLYWAIFYGHRETAEFLINAGAAVDSKTAKLIAKKLPGYDYLRERTRYQEEQAETLKDTINLPRDLAYLIVSFEKGAFVGPPSRKRDRETHNRAVDESKAKRQRHQLP